MTPSEFEKRMKDINKNADIEAGHAEADDLMCEILESLGYTEGVHIFRTMDKWYA